MEYISNAISLLNNSFIAKKIKNNYNYYINGCVHNIKCDYCNRTIRYDNIESTKSEFCETCCEISAYDKI